MGTVLVSGFDRVRHELDSAVAHQHMATALMSTSGRKKTGIEIIHIHANGAVRWSDGCEVAPNASEVSPFETATLLSIRSNTLSWYKGCGRQPKSRACGIDEAIARLVSVNDTDSSNRPSAASTRVVVTQIRRRFSGADCVRKTVEDILEGRQLSLHEESTTRCGTLDRTSGGFVAEVVLTE